MERPGFLAAVAGLTFCGGSWAAVVWQYELLRLLGLVGALAVVILFLAPALAAGLWLRNSPDPRLKAVGAAVETVAEHEALFLGSLLTVVVYWGVALAGGDTVLPASGDEFLVDFVAACLVLGALIDVVAAGMAAAYSTRSRIRRLALLDLVVLVAVPAVVVGAGLTGPGGWGAGNPAAFAFLGTLYQAVASALTWRLVIAPEEVAP